MQCNCRIFSDIIIDCPYPSWNTTMISAPLPKPTTKASDETNTFLLEGKVNFPNQRPISEYPHFEVDLQLLASNYWSTVHELYIN